MFRRFSRSNGSNPSTIQSYIAKLRTRYPHVDAPSLIASFLILHELTAIVPLFIGFVGLKQLGVGESMISWTMKEVGDEAGAAGPSWSGTKLRGWMKEGNEQADRIGRRYGILGFEKESKADREEMKRSIREGMVDATTSDGQALRVGGGDVANLVASYLLVKASSSP